MLHSVISPHSGSVGPRDGVFGNDEKCPRLDLHPRSVSTCMSTSSCSYTCLSSLRDVIEGVGEVILAIIPLLLTDSLQVNK